MEEKSSNGFPNILWEWGTVYDLFTSLHVLHHPDRFGLRGAWAAGVRSRLAAPQRRVLEDAQDLFGTPIAWIYSLPAPKDAEAALATLGRIPSSGRLPALALSPEMPEEMEVMLQKVAARRLWDDQDLDTLRLSLQQSGRPARPKTLVNILEWWSRPDEFGERYLEALQAYQAAFFGEEERRIRPVVQDALAQAQEQARRLDFPALVEKLSQGLYIATLTEAAEVVLVPSYWITPLVFYGRVSPERLLLLFGGRPADMALMPGEMVPDAMLHALKALADPTRLRVLHYLSGEPLTPSQLSRRLRLRAPTMIHHLNELRLAGLVRVSVDAQGERRYAIRSQAVGDTFTALDIFLGNDQAPGET